MTVAIDETDLAWLQVQFPELDFTDAERRTVLTSMDSIDVQAVPGSGKTTLLAAKLALIASKWPYAKRGICVLSHTNVAREEIERRLSRTQDGQRLLSHPHFIGTIQTFAHSFFALPLARSLDITPYVIDDEYFAERAIDSIFNKWSVKAWHNNAPHKAASVIRSLTFVGSNLDIGCTDGKMPQSTAKSYPELQEIKYDLARKGIFRYADMFAFAKYVFVTYPSIVEAIRHRFPLVFLDEMQDTNSAQETLLTEAFGTAACIQRYGDVSQQILNDSDTDFSCSFPRAGYMNVATSKRFGPAIAAVANRIRATGNDIVGDGVAAVAPPTLLLFEDTTIHNVISSFGMYVAELFTADELATGAIKAVCARKGGTSNKGLGRQIHDYFHAFDDSSGKPTSVRPLFIDVIRDVAKSRRHGSSLSNAVSMVRSALFQILHHAESPYVSNVRRWRDFIIALEKSAISEVKSAEFVREYVLSPPNIDSAEDWRKAQLALFASLNTYLLPSMSESEFCGLPYLAYTDVNPHLGAPLGATASGNQFHVVHAGKSFAIDISTIAGVKGETHLATLVLESFLKSQFDVMSSLKYLCGEADSTSIALGLLHRQMRNLFVGITRPTRLLCVAMHRARLTAEYETKLLGCGWAIRSCV